MSKQIRKIKLPGDNEEYELISTIQTDTDGIEIGRQIDVGDEKCQTATAKATSALAQGDYIFRLGATETNPSDYRFNEAYGTGSMAAGMGAVAYSRASKSLGYRTQTGMPASQELFNSRPEAVYPNVEFKNISYESKYKLNLVNEKGTITYFADGVWDESGTLIDNGHQISLKIQPAYDISLTFSAPYLNGDEQIQCYTSEGDFTIELTDDNNHYATKRIQQVSQITIQESFSSFVETLKVTISALPSENVGQAAMAIGSDTAATANNAFAGGWQAKANGTNSFAFGGTNGAEKDPKITQATANNAIAIGGGVTASGQYSFASGFETVASGIASHAESRNTTASGVCSHAEGQNTLAEGNYSHAEGEATKAMSLYSHAEGSNTTAQYQAAHAEGRKSKALYHAAHAEGQETTAEGGEGAHAEGFKTIASAKGAHAAGCNTQATHEGSTATGNSTITGREYQVVIGQFNEVDEGALFVVGNGTDNDNRSNAFVIKEDGTLSVASSVIDDATINTLTIGKKLIMSQTASMTVGQITTSSMKINNNQFMLGGTTINKEFFKPYYVTSQTSVSNIIAALNQGRLVYYHPTNSNEYYALNKIASGTAYFGSRKGLTNTYDAQIPPKTS